MVNGKSAEIRVFALMANGATGRWNSSYEVRDNGSVDLTMLKTTLELADFVAAVNERDTIRARGLIDALPPEGPSREIANTVLSAQDPDRTTIDLESFQGEEQKVRLSQVKPSEVSVGWGKPVYDFLPRPETLLVSSGRLHVTGIYAHAPARHVYDFPEGHDWKTLKGFCGLPDQRGGSVVFRILADGKQVFASPKVEPGKSHFYEIDLTGVGRLELTVGNAGDDNAVDWGYWLDPVLTR